MSVCLVWDGSQIGFVDGVDGSFDDSLILMSGRSWVHPSNHKLQFVIKEI